MTKYKAIDEKAQKLLVKSNALTYPVKLDQIVNHLKLSLNEKPLEDEYSGFLAVKEKNHCRQLASCSGTTTFHHCP